MISSLALSLDDPAWGGLAHAYGSADDIPDLLRALENSPRPAESSQSEPWFTLWSSLCHQGDVYTASYAAVPHLLRIVLECEMPFDFSFFMLPTAIEIARYQGRGPVMPDFLEPAYQAAMSSLGECVRRHLSSDWNENFLMAALPAIAVAKGYPRIAEAVMNLDDDWIAQINGEDVK